MGAAITFGMDRATERRMEGQGRTVFHDLVGRVYVVAIGGPRSTWLPAGEALHLQQEEHTPAGDAMPAGAVRRPWMAPRRPWMAARRPWSPEAPLEGCDGIRPEGRGVREGSGPFSAFDSR